MTEPAGPGAGDTAPARAADGLSLIGEYQGSGFTEPRFLVRRGDGQVIQLSRLLYLVTAAIAEGAADGGWGPGRVARRVGEELGRDVTADNVRYLVRSKLAPLGVVAVSGPRPPGDAPATAPPPRVNLLLGLRARGVLLPPRAAGAAGQALAWLHYPALAAPLLAAFAAAEAWFFAVHGVLGPVVSVLQDPVLFLAVAGLTLVSLLFHELGHASACRYGGARPGVIGFGLYLVFPSLYTDVTDAYRLSRAGRLRTDLGGVYFNALFILLLFGCYAVTGSPVFLAAAFLDNFQVLQQLFPLVRMDGYFILGDLAGVPDLFGLLGPIMASLLPGARGRRAAARVRSLRPGPRLMVTAWVLTAVPLLLALSAYTAFSLPMLISTAARTFSSDIAAARAGFTGGSPAAGLVAAISVVLLILPAAGLAYLLVSVVSRLARRLLRNRSRGRAIAAGAAALLTAAVVAAAVVVTGSGSPVPVVPPLTAAASRSLAAAWVSTQVSPSATVACDPPECAQLRQDGFPAGKLRPLAGGAAALRAAAVVVATPDVQDQFGPALAADYAPQVLASFGAGSARVDVRTVAPGGGAAFAATLAADHPALVMAGRQLLGNKDITTSPAARAALLSGQVDGRLLSLLSLLSQQAPIRLVAFTGTDPGASSSVLLRGVEISAGSTITESALLAVIKAQQGEYRPAAAAVTGGGAGGPVVAVRYDAPAALSLTQAPASRDLARS